MKTGLSGSVVYVAVASHGDLDASVSSPDLSKRLFVARVGVHDRMQLGRVAILISQFIVRRLAV